MKTVGVGLVCAALWLLLSGHYSGLLLSLGLLSCGLVTWLACRLQIVDDDLPGLQALGRLLLYLPWLLKEIAQSNIDVIRLILDPKLPVSPQLFETRVSQRSDMARVIYANSITLTPGTISVQVHDDIIEVHALTAAAAAGVESGEMDRRVTRIEGG